MIKKLLRQIVPEPIIQASHKIRGVAAAYNYGFPAKKMIVIGVTGTKGKTTTSTLIAKILEQAGYKVGLLTTVNFKIGDKEWVNETNMGTLPPFKLQKLLKEMADAGCQYVVLETTSHSLAQHRVYGIDYAVAVFTNLSHEHLDYHKSLEEYRNTKGKMFAGNPGLIVVNADDKTADYFLSFKADKKVTYGLDHKADVTAKKILYDATATGSHFSLITSRGDASIQTSLPGRFNVYNILAATATTLYLGIELPTIKTAIQNLKSVAGRMEKVDVGAPFSTIVDYAHTPDSFEKIYETIRPATKGRIIHVFGLTGDRDRTKRPIMGAIAGRNADIVILTDDEPYTEDPQQIVNEIAKGVPRGASKEKPIKENINFFKILDRREAINKALSLAQKGDVVLITGMGALTHRTVGTQHLPWRDQDVIREEWAKISSK
jgi:UDP-N-acetylmuramoyl-L-alanyl-D-glutamate--2,6-diaminopimelate ligase